MLGALLTHAGFCPLPAAPQTVLFPRAPAWAHRYDWQSCGNTAWCQRAATVHDQLLCPGFLSNKMEIIIQPCRADRQMRANKYLKWEKNKAQWPAAGESEVICHWIYSTSTGNMEYARERAKSLGRRWFSAFEIMKEDALRSQEPTIKRWLDNVSLIETQKTQQRRKAGVIFQTGKEAQCPAPPHTASK